MLDGEGLRITFHNASQGELVLHLEGAVDVATVGALDEALNQACGDGVDQITVDMAGVAFFNSAGTHALTRAATRTRQHGSRLVVRNPRPIDRRVFAILGLDSLLTIEPSHAVLAKEDGVQEAY